MSALISQEEGPLKGFVQLDLEHTAMSNCSCGLTPVFQANACDFIFFCLEAISLAVLLEACLCHITSYFTCYFLEIYIFQQSTCFM